MSKKRPLRTATATAEPVKTSWPERAEGFIGRHSVAIFLVLVALGSVRIAATYSVFNHTIDEPAHIACGMEWLAKKTYTYEAQHPPFARVMSALLPYLDGTHSWGRPVMYNEGAAVLYTDDHYDRTLNLARLGIMPFFWLASFVVYWWTRRSFGDLPAFFATLCFTFLPSALAHAGLATTDMALTGTFGAAFVAMLAWLEQPGWGRSAIFGVALGASILSKFSVLVFFPAATGVALAFYLIYEKPGLARIIGLVKTRFGQLILALAVACLLIWAGYRFTVVNHVPAPQFFAGIQEVRNHNRLGNPGFLLGQYGETGWWYYYPVVLAVKTPLALLALLGVGLAVCWRRRRESMAYTIPIAFALGTLAVGVFSRINIGVRHILPVYLAFSVIAAVGARNLWNSGRAGRRVLAGLLFWLVASSALSHPDYLAYFNALAGDQPEKIVVDSDLDWGQDMKRLSARLREVGATEVAFDPFIIAHLEKVHGFPPIKPLDPRGPMPGWNAVSLTMLRLDRMGLKQENLNFQLWPDRIPPTERVGKGVLLYYAPRARNR